MTLDEFRSRFPIFKRRVYVNSCSQGALSTDVDEAMRALPGFVARGRLALGDVGGAGRTAARAIRRVDWRRRRRDRRHAERIGRDQRDRERAQLRRTAIARRHRRFRVSDDGADLAGAGAPRRDHPPGSRAVVVADTLPLEAYDAVIDERTLIVPATHVCFRNGHKTDIAGLVRLSHDRGALRLPRRLPAHGLGPDRRPRARRRFHGHRLPEVPARGGRHRLSVRATGAHRSASSRRSPAGSGASIRSRSGSTTLDWPPGANRFESGTPPVPNAYAAARRVGSAGPRRLRRRRPPGRPPGRPVRGCRRGGRVPGANAGRGGPPRAAGRRAKRRRAGARADASPREASSRRAAATDCASRSTRTTPTATSTTVIGALARESALLERSTAAKT